MELSRIVGDLQSSSSVKTIAVLTFDCLCSELIRDYCDLHQRESAPMLKIMKESVGAYLADNAISPATYSEARKALERANTTVRMLGSLSDAPALDLTPCSPIFAESLKCKMVSTVKSNT